MCRDGAFISGAYMLIDGGVIAFIAAGRYQRVTQISQSQLGFLTGVTEFYRARTDTKMTIAAERLAVIADVTLPVTALSSVLGMNMIVNDRTRWPALAMLLLAVLTLS